ncbi:MAG: type II secretion system GspH family protein [Lentisphaeraceae bacterium]|nr:type II secretion system GspH family protein [Lentisphaeraceae bacterium]
MKKFTLLELMVVIAIFGILMSMLLPSLKNSRRSAKSAVCMSNLKQLGSWSMVFAQEHNNILPHKCSNQTFNGYYDNKHYDKAEKYTHFTSIWKNDYGMAKEGLNCPQAREELNPRWGGGSNEFSDFGQNWYLGGHKYSKLPFVQRLSSQNYLYSDGYIWDLVNGDNYHIPAYIRFKGNGTGHMPWMTDDVDYPALKGHPKETSNFLMGDLHIETRNRRSLMTLSGNTLNEWNGID